MPDPPPSGEPRMTPNQIRDKRGESGAPPWGRRAEDEPVHQMVYELQQLQATMAELRAQMAKTPKAEPMTFQRLVTLVGGASAVTGVIVGLMAWLGGNIAGPGARFEEFERQEARSDSAAVAERQAMMQAVGELSNTVARFGYDVCVLVYKRPQDACFNDYLAQQSRINLPTAVPAP